MKNITVFDIEADALEKIAIDNGISECEIIEALMEYIEDAKENNGWI